MAFVDTLDLKLEPNGHIKCLDCKTYWCKHLQACVLDNSDSELIWEDPKSDVILEVPMIPTHNQWARMSLITTDLPTPTYEVNYVDADTGALHELGFLHPGEGRGVLRSMMFDWFTGFVDPREIACRASSHKFVQQMQWEEDMKKGGSRQMAQLWCAWQSRSCLNCTWSTPDPDLIPDASDPANKPKW